MLRNAIVRASLRDAIERLPRLPLDDLPGLSLDDLPGLPLDDLPGLPLDDLPGLYLYDLARQSLWDLSRPLLDEFSILYELDYWSAFISQEPAPLICCPDYTVLQELSSFEDREIRAMNWSDRCSLKWRLYNSGHPHGGCRFSEPSMLLSIIGVQPRKLRVKDWQNAHGKVGIVGRLFHLGAKKGRKHYFQHCYICLSGRTNGCWASLNC